MPIGRYICQVTPREIIRLTGANKNPNTIPIKDFIVPHMIEIRPLRSKGELPALPPELIESKEPDRSEVVLSEFI
jgi:hypothetical protein